MILVIYLFIFGIAVGSFLNVLIDRLPQGEGIGGRSKCDHCQKKLAWIDLIPVISWLSLGGKCRYCKKKISAWYPIVELITGVAFVVVFVCFMGSGMLGEANSREISRFATSWVASLGMTISALGIICALIVIFFADLKYHLIPDEATFALVLFSAPFVLLGGELKKHVVASILMFLILYLLYILTKRRGMGFGDVKLAGAMGWLLGLQNGLIALYLAFLAGGIVSAILILFRTRGLKSTIAFGPFLVLGTVVMFFFSAEVGEIARKLFQI